MGDVTSTLTMKLLDQISPGAKKVGQALKTLNADVKRFTGASDRSFTKLNKTFVESEKAVGRLARAWRPISSGGGPVAGLDRVTAAAARAERAVARAGRSARAFTAAGATPHGSGEADRPGFHEPHARAVAAAAAAHATKSIATDAAKSAAAIEQERIAADTSGLSPGDQAALEARAFGLSKKYPSVSQSVVMHMLRNARAATGDLHHAFDVMDSLVKLRVLAQAKRPEADATKEFDDLVRAMEMKGVTSNPEKFREYMDGMAKAINIFGDTVTPSAYYQMFKYGRGATPGYSDEYMLKVAPTLASEMGGASAGTAGAAFHQSIIGRRLSQGALKELAALGLLDAGKFSTSKGGKITTAPGAIVGTDLARRDPYDWVNSVFLPALAARGITEPEAIGDHIAAVFGNRMAQQIVTIFATQQQRIEKDRRNVSGAQGLAAADEYLARDPAQGVAAVKAQAENLLGNASSPLVPAATSALRGLADALAYLSDAARRHPVAGTEGLIAGTAATAWGSAEAARALMHWLGFGGGGAAGGGFLARLAMVGRAAGPVGLGTLAFNALIDGFLNADDAGRTHPYGPPGSAWREQYERNRAGNTDLIAARNRADARRSWREGTLMQDYPDRGFHAGASSPAISVGRLDAAGVEADAAALARRVQSIFDSYRPTIHPYVDMPEIPSASSLLRKIHGSYGDDNGRR